MGFSPSLPLLEDMNKTTRLILSAILLILGLCILLYPKISNYVNQLHSSQAIQHLAQQMETASDNDLLQQLQLARDYNTHLLSFAGFSSDFDPNYYNILDFGGHMMGYIEIPAIDVSLPIYHGVSAEVLAKGIGHMPQTAFPIGGTGNHSVLTGHTGLPSAELFTNLYRLQIGDTFTITIANQSVTYRVEQIKVVLPTQTEDLLPIPGTDHCTLLTCTPYGINSHRLLVRGICISVEENKK